MTWTHIQPAMCYCRTYVNIYRSDICVHVSLITYNTNVVHSDMIVLFQDHTAIVYDRRNSIGLFVKMSLIKLDNVECKWR